MKTFWIVAALLLAACCTQAQEQDAPKQPPPQQEQQPEQADDGHGHETPPTDRPARRDPTAGAAGQGWRNATRHSTVELPAIALKARVFVKGKPPAVLLQVGDALHLVREGSSIALPGKRQIVTPAQGGRSTPRGQAAKRTTKTTLNLKVTKIDAESVQVEVPDHDPLILR